MAQHQHTHSLPDLEEALTVLFCLIDDRYRLLNPRGARRYESIKRLSDSEIITLALLQQLRGVESERSFLRDAKRFFSHLFPGVAGLHPSSFNRRVRKLRCFLEPLRREVLSELWWVIPKDLAHRLHLARSPPSAPSCSVGGFRWSRVGTLGFLQRLWG